MKSLYLYRRVEAAIKNFIEKPRHEESSTSDCWGIFLWKKYGYQ
jgi:hypothetical protein